MSFWKDVGGDVRNWVVNVAMTALVAGIVFVLAPVGAAILKAIRNEPMPWFALIGIAVVGVALILVAILFLRRIPDRPPTTGDNPDAPIVLPPKEPVEVTFENSKCLIVRVINNDPNKEAKIKSVAVFGIKGGEEKQILSTKVPNDPKAIPGGWRLDSVAMPYYLGQRDAKNFETLILEANLSAYGNTAYFAEVTLQTGEVVRSKVIPVTPRENATLPKPVSSSETNIGRDDRALIDVANAVNRGTKFFWALLDAKADELSRAELISVCETLMARGHKNEMEDIPKDCWLQVLREARLSADRPQDELALLDFIWDLARNVKPTPPS